MSSLDDSLSSDEPDPLRDADTEMAHLRGLITQTLHQTDQGAPAHVIRTFRELVYAHCVRTAEALYTEEVPGHLGNTDEPDNEEMEPA